MHLGAQRMRTEDATGGGWYLAECAIAGAGGRRAGGGTFFVEPVRCGQCVRLGVSETLCVSCSTKFRESAPWFVSDPRDEPMPAGGVPGPGGVP